MAVAVRDNKTGQVRDRDKNKDRRRDQGQGQDLEREWDRAGQGRTDRMRP